MVSLSQIQSLAQAIRDIVSPKAIYLFGSYAMGHPTPHSDVDIAIIKEHISNKHEDLYRIRKALFHSGIPMDLILMEEQDYLANKDHWGGVSYEIAHHGLPLYETSGN
jgi:predicted nucleotidyltransferase